MPVHFPRYIIANLPWNLLLPAFTGTTMYWYSNDITVSFRALLTMAVLVAIVNVWSYFCRPTQLRFSGPKIYVTVRGKEQEIINLRKDDVQIRQTRRQSTANTCDIRLKDTRIQAYATRGGVSVIHGVQDCAAIREYISRYFL